MSELLDLVKMHGVGTDGSTSKLVEDAMLEFGDDEVSIKVLDKMASVWAHVRGPFDNVRRGGSFMVDDIDRFGNWMGRFGDRTVVSIEEQDGLFYVTFSDEDRKEGQFTAEDESHINSAQNVEDLPYEFDQENFDCPGAYDENIMLDAHFTCDVSDITDVINDGDTTEVRKFPIMVDDGHVQFKVGDDDGWIETEFTADSGEGYAESIYGYGMDNVFSNISGQVTVYLADDCPMWIHQDRETGELDYAFDYMIAEDET